MRRDGHKNVLNSYTKCAKKVSDALDIWATFRNAKTSRNSLYIVYIGTTANMSDLLCISESSRQCRPDYRDSLQNTGSNKLIINDFQNTSKCLLMACR